MFYVQNTHKIPPDDFCYVPYRIPFLHYISIFFCFYRVSSAIILFLLTKINQRVVIKYEILPNLQLSHPDRCQACRPASDISVHFSEGWYFPDIFPDPPSGSQKSVLPLPGTENPPTGSQTSSGSGEYWSFHPKAPLILEKAARNDRETEALHPRISGPYPENFCRPPDPAVARVIHSIEETAQTVTPLVSCFFRVLPQVPRKMHITFPMCTPKIIAAVSWSWISVPLNI